MNIVIFEDKASHQTYMKDIIQRYIAHKGLNASIALITDSLAEIERYIERNQIYTLYFIDIVDEMGYTSGLKLSEEIRQKSNTDIIVFITHYLKEVIYSTCHKMLALNIIAKNSRTVRKEICDTIEYAYSNIQTDDYLVIDSPNGDTFRVAFDDIYAIETIKGRHKICIHYRNGSYICAGLLKEIALKLDERFRRCHKSYIINLDKIEQISKARKEIKLNNGLLVNYAPRYNLQKEI